MCRINHAWSFNYQVLDNFNSGVTIRLWLNRVQRPAKLTPYVTAKIQQSNTQCDKSERLASFVQSRESSNAEGRYYTEPSE